MVDTARRRNNIFIYNLSDADAMDLRDHLREKGISHRLTITHEFNPEGFPEH